MTSYADKLKKNVADFSPESVGLEPKSVASTKPAPKPVKVVQKPQQTEDFPALENDKPVVVEQVEQVESVVEPVQNQEAAKPPVPEESLDNAGFIEKKKRGSERNQDRGGRPGSSRNSSRQTMNRNGDGKSSFAARRVYRKSETSEAGESKTFDERFAEETAKYTNRFKEPKENLCFELVKGDLFSANEAAALAHCVSEDFSMSKGIAVEFKKRFGGVDELLAQHLKVGSCAYLKINERYVFYLITKKFFFHKPYYNSIERSLKDMRKLCAEFNIAELAMPMIGSGLDKLDWELVARIVDDVFAKTNIKLTVYKFEKVFEKRPAQRRNKE